MLTDNIKTPPTSSMRNAPFQHHVAQITLPFFCCANIASHTFYINFDFEEKSSGNQN
jgi:hypothetical protein